MTLLNNTLTQLEILLPIIYRALIIVCYVYTLGANTNSPSHINKEN